MATWIINGSISGTGSVTQLGGLGGEIESPLSCSWSVPSAAIMGTITSVSFRFVGSISADVGMRAVALAVGQSLPGIFVDLYGGWTGTQGEDGYTFDFTHTLGAFSLASFGAAEGGTLAEECAPEINSGGPAGTVTVALTLWQLIIVCTNNPCCLDTITPDSATISNSGDEGEFRVLMESQNCDWTATSNNSWIQLLPGCVPFNGSNGVSSVSGTGDGNVCWVTDSNLGDARTGTITVSGGSMCAYDIFTITQQAGSGTGGGTGPDFTQLHALAVDHPRQWLYVATANINHAYNLPGLALNFNGTEIGSDAIRALCVDTRTDLLFILGFSDEAWTVYRSGDGGTSSESILSVTAKSMQIGFHSVLRTLIAVYADDSDNVRLQTTNNPAAATPTWTSPITPQVSGSDMSGQIQSITQDDRTNGAFFLAIISSGNGDVLMSQDLGKNWKSILS